MGREIESALRARGHEVAVIVAGHAGAGPVIGPQTTGRCDVAFEFTRPEAAALNVEALLASGCRAIVCGTTGWKEALPRVSSRIQEAEAGLVHADNFSLGMALFSRLVERAAQLCVPEGYAPWIAEWHHAGKADAPSGTARQLAGLLERAAPGLHRHEGDRAGGMPEGAFAVASVRAGWIPGTHQVGFDSGPDTLELTHRARGRGGFAAGAVLAGEWVVSRTGVFTFSDCLDDPDRRTS